MSLYSIWYDPEPNRWFWDPGHLPPRDTAAFNLGMEGLEARNHGGCAEHAFLGSVGKSTRLGNVLWSFFAITSYGWRHPSLLVKTPYSNPTGGQIGYMIHIFQILQSPFDNQITVFQIDDSWYIIHWVMIITHESFVFFPTLSGTELLHVSW